MIRGIVFLTQDIAALGTAPGLPETFNLTKDEGYGKE